MTRILFMYPGLASFVQKDLDIFKSKYDVIPFQYRSLRDLPKVMWHSMRSDIIFSWFIDDMNAYFGVIFAKIFFKKSLMLVGGGDVTSMPEIGYGGALSPKRKRRMEYVLKNADGVIAISEFTKSEAQKIYPRKDIINIYHGFDSSEFVPSGEKENIAITIGKVSNSNLARKGIELFVRAAKFLPNHKFVVVGGLGDGAEKLNEIKTPNVHLTGRVSDEELIRWMQRAKVYVQVSKHEGFGCSLAEAMLCGCIPVATKIAAIPEVVGDTGFYVDEKPEAVAAGIEQAFADLNKCQLARERIAKNFPLEKRKDAMLKEVEKTLGSSK